MSLSGFSIFACILLTDAAVVRSEVRVDGTSSSAAYPDGMVCCCKEATCSADSVGQDGTPAVQHYEDSTISCCKRKKKCDDWFGTGYPTLLVGHLEVKDYCPADDASVKASMNVIKDLWTKRREFQISKGSIAEKIPLEMPDKVHNLGFSDHGLISLEDALGSWVNQHQLDLVISRAVGTFCEAAVKTLHCCCASGLCSPGTKGQDGNLAVMHYEKGGAHCCKKMEKCDSYMGHTQLRVGSLNVHDYCPAEPLLVPHSESMILAGAWVDKNNYEAANFNK